MSEQQIKFMVNRIYAKDISLESPESPKIFNELKLQPKVGFNLNTSIEKIEENTFDVTLNISIKAEAEERVIYLVELKQSGIFSIEGADENLLSSFLNIRCPEVVFPYAMETATTLIQKSGFPQYSLLRLTSTPFIKKNLQAKTKIK